jgi:leucyl aminopeptidase
MLDSKIADTNNVSAGLLRARLPPALFLSRFVGEGLIAFFDLFAWNPSARPGRPEGGEAHTIRALFALLAERYR